MKHRLHKGLLVFLTVLFCGIAQAQNITGTVSDGSGPLPGASVVVKGTQNSASTDLNGKYAIQNAGANAVLVFSYIGLASQEVAVAGKSVVNVVLKDDQEKLKEVVVIGYGSVKKKDATGAIDQISSKKFDNIAATSPAELLRGKLAGVQVTSSSGEPGAAASIRIRGVSSIRSGNDPLIVVDGVPLDGGNVSSGGADLVGSSAARNPLNFINQNDIESISILKDASSTAIYGSRGASGVIMITTKKSKSKEPQLDFNSSVSFGKFSGELDVMSANEFVANGGADTGSREYDWKKAILQTGLTVNNDISFSKSSETSNTRLSFGASNMDGIIKNSGLDKYTLSLSNSNDFFGGDLKVDSKVLYAGLKDKGALVADNAGFIGSLVGSALYWNPTNPIYNNSAAGYYNPGYVADNPATAANEYQYGSDTYLNPVQILDSYKDFTNTNKILASIKSTLKLSSSFNYQFLFGVEGSNSARKSQLLPSIRIQNVAQGTNPSTTPPSTSYGQANINTVEKINTTFEHTLNYNKSFTDNFQLDAVVGTSAYRYDYSGYFAQAKGFNPDQTNLIDNIGGSISTLNSLTSNRNKSGLNSIFGRVNLTVFKKLLLTASVRRDGSSKLGSDDQYGIFPAAAIAYKVFENKEGLVNDLKVRLGYGKTGNQEFAANSAVERGTFGSNGSLNQDSGGNGKLRWETVTSSNFGLDFTLIKNRLSGSLDYYTKKTEDLIFPVATAGVLPAPPVVRNVNLPGYLDTKGIELSLNLKLIEKENISWSISGNVSNVDQKMKDFVPFVQTGGINGQGLSGAYAQVITNNQPLYSYYLYEFRGYDNTGSSIYSDAAGNDAPLGLAAKQYVGKQGQPKTNIGFSTNFSYKNFDTSVSFYGAYGHYIYNNTANAYFFKGAFLGGRNVTQDAAASEQDQSDPNSPSTKYLENGDFLRLGNLTIGYTLNGGILDRAKIKSARFYVNGQNLLLFTDYSGFDPEININKSLNGVPSAGVDYLAYPRSKTFTFGLNLNF